MNITAIIPAAGAGARYSQYKNKLLEELGGLPVIVRTLETISSVEEIKNIIVCTTTDLIADIKDFIERYQIPKIHNVILGGMTRQESVFLGIRALEGAELPDYVLVHDAARPLITKEIIKNAVSTAFQKDNVVVAVKTKDTIKKVDDHLQILETIDRSQLWNVQTPQIFKYKDLLDAHIKFKGQNFTDDSSMLEKNGIKVFVVQGDYKNLKITTREDLMIAQTFLKNL